MHPSPARARRVRSELQSDSLLPAGGLSGRNLAGGDLELVATVPREARLIFFGARRALLAEAHDLDAAAIDPAVGEVALRRGGAALAEGEVVLVGPTAIRVAGDANADGPVLRHDRHLGIELRPRLVGDVGRVVVEVDRRRERRRQRGDRTI